jgi:hypothetical protein
MLVKLETFSSRIGGVGFQCGDGNIAGNEAYLVEGHSLISVVK